MPPTAEQQKAEQQPLAEEELEQQRKERDAPVIAQLRASAVARLQMEQQAKAKRERERKLFLKDHRELEKQKRLLAKRVEDDGLQRLKANGEQQQESQEDVEGEGDGEAELERKRNVEDQGRSGAEQREA